jgi:hypothetical protein
MSQPVQRHSACGRFGRRPRLGGSLQVVRTGDRLCRELVFVKQPTEEITAADDEGGPFLGRRAWRRDR